MKILSLFSFAVALTLVACGSTKGSSSLDSVVRVNSAPSRSAQPVVRADADKATSVGGADSKTSSWEAQKRAEQQALQVSAAAKQKAEEVSEQVAQAESVAKEAARQAAEKAKAEAEATQAKAQAEAEKIAAEAQAKAEDVATKVTVREEKVRIVESSVGTSGNYYLIAGSYKSMTNAKAAVNKALGQGYLPSIMEDDNGIYRVALFNADDEQMARDKVKEIVAEYPEYKGLWLLKAK
ncbi:MAG: SPOR domain-containing protein [Marinilabiliaceae bacterium]|nr:SPOR domain-containing protein [Marinilabiliaceae bacterium]